MIVTFYNDRIDKDIVKYQKIVFDLFKIDINQICPDVWMNHSGSIDYFMENCKEEWEYFILFDIDCIPLDKFIVPEAIEWVKRNDGLFSVAQKASHIPNSIVYASPAFLAFSRKTYEILGKPKFIATQRSDCGGEFTHLAIEKGLPIKLMWPTHVSVPKWDLTDKIKFGIGTNYENKIYHQFESRKTKNDFIRKCNEVINKNK